MGVTFDLSWESNDCGMEHSSFQKNFYGIKTTSKILASFKITYPDVLSMMNFYPGYSSPLYIQEKNKHKFYFGLLMLVEKLVVYRSIISNECIM